MAIALYFTITLFVALLYFFLEKKLSFLENAIIFMVISIITRTSLTVFSLELERMQITEDPFLFIAFLLEREFIIPLTVLIFINIYYSSFAMKAKILLLFGVLLFMYSMNVLTNYYGIITHKNWGNLNAFLVSLAYLLIGIGLPKVTSYLQQWEIRKNDNSI
jgi:hypothetical protein